MISDKLRQEIAEELATIIRERIAADLARENEKIAVRLAGATEAVASQLATKHLKMYLSIVVLNLAILALLIFRF